MAIKKAKKAGKKAPKPAPRPKQKRLAPDWGNDVHPDIEQAGENYADAVAERLPKTAKEKDAKNTLIAVMRTHNTFRYKMVDGWTIELTAKDNVSIKKPPADESTDDD